MPFFSPLFTISVLFSSHYSLAEKHKQERCIPRSLVSVVTNQGHIGEGATIKAESDAFHTRMTRDPLKKVLSCMAMAFTAALTRLRVVAPARNRKPAFLINPQEIPQSIPSGPIWWEALV